MKFFAQSSEQHSNECQTKVCVYNNVQIISMKKTGKINVMGMAVSELARYCI